MEVAVLYGLHCNPIKMVIIITKNKIIIIPSK